MQDLFDERWLIRCGDEWSLNISMKRSYGKIQTMPSQQKTAVQISGLFIHPLPVSGTCRAEDTAETSD